MVKWEDDEHFVVGGTAFQALPEGSPGHRGPARDGEFRIFKPRAAVERYAALIAELQPRRIFELGIRMGGSTVFFAELARPERLVAIDCQPLRDVIPRIRQHLAGSDLEDVVRPVGEVDQADRARLAELVDEHIDGGPLDLVVDDCSHLYEPTRASFNELFPRLRPGGLYVIEDWRWAHPPVHSEHPERVLYPGQVPLTRLLFEAGLAIPGLPGLVSEIRLDIECAVIRRGDAHVDPAAFEIAACSNRLGRALLAS
jgi:predicted O-methyltransferase YrrM